MALKIIRLGQVQILLLMTLDITKLNKQDLVSSIIHISLITKGINHTLRNSKVHFIRGGWYSSSANYSCRLYLSCYMMINLFVKTIYGLTPIRRYPHILGTMYDVNVMIEYQVYRLSDRYIFLPTTYIQLIFYLISAFLYMNKIKNRLK